MSESQPGKSLPISSPPGPKTLTTNYEAGSHPLALGRLLPHLGCNTSQHEVQQRISVRQWLLGELLQPGQLSTRQQTRQQDDSREQCTAHSQHLLRSASSFLRVFGPCQKGLRSIPGQGSVFRMRGLMFPHLHALSICLRTLHPLQAPSFGSTNTPQSQHHEIATGKQWHRPAPRSLWQSCLSML